MIVRNLYIRRAVLISWPLEANPILLIDADAVLSLSIAAEGFEPVASQSDEVLDGFRGGQDFKAFFGLLLDSLKRRDEFAFRETAGPSITTTLDHGDP